MLRWVYRLRKRESPLSLPETSEQKPVGNGCGGPDGGGGARRGAEGGRDEKRRGSRADRQRPKVSRARADKRETIRPSSAVGWGGAGGGEPVTTFCCDRSLWRIT
ncbi:hypothetical protein J6590_019740 [Homalodisca vitripennis]|nr:hypothetical protein J6590_019740 [Homalodisca vitripennis]